jgi:holo-[acyl-carrier protein] synthase
MAGRMEERDWFGPAENGGEGMGIRCGVDIIETARIRLAVERQGVRFLDRIFTPAEQECCLNRGASRMNSLAVRFAAKEAVSKALGTGIGSGASFLDIEIIQAPGGRPYVVLYGAAEKSFRRLNGIDLAISLSHERTLAVAQAVILTR